MSTPRRFVPRPSPERLAAQIQGLEATQERVTELLTAQNRQLIEEFKQHSMNIMDEMRTQRLSTLDEMKSQRQNVTDLKMEMKQGLHDIKVEVTKLGMIMKEAAGRQASTSPVKATVDPTYHREIRDALALLPKQIAAALPPPPPPIQQLPAPSVTLQSDASASKGLSLAEMQEALAQQTALLQMGGFGFAAGMMARPPIPPQPHLPPAAAAPPPLPPQPIPQQQTWIPPQSTAAPPATVVPPQLPTVPAAPAVIQAAPETPKAPQQPAAATVASPKLHEYQINIPKVSPVEDPFKGQEGPAVPVVTTALLSNIPSPAFSSLAKTPPTNKTTAVPSQATPPAPATGSLFDKFKPKAGSWECGGCMLRNEGDKIICPSCEAVKPGHEEEAKKLKEAEEAAKPKITFGAGGGFKFGVQPSAAASSTTTATKAKEDEKPSPFAGFSFGNQGAAAGGGGFAFAKPGAGAKSDEGDHLSFDGQGLKLNKGAEAEPMAKTIAEFKNMKKLTFSGNTIGIEAASVIGKALEKHPEFQEAHWKDMFTGRMKTEIPPALIHLGKGIMTAKAQLTVLDLSDNAFGPIGMEGIVELLKSPSCYTLKELRLNNTGCGTTGGTKLARTLMTCYEKSKEAGKPLALKVFVLGRSRQENDGATELAKVFKVMGSLEEVVMPQNGIYHQGIKALSEAFCKNPNLRIINLNDNTFTPKGAKHFAEALGKLNKLVYLNLGDCLLKTEGCHYIAEALKGNGHQALEELHVDCNEIKIDGGKAIIDAIQSKPSIKVLNVDGNRFGDNGCDEIIALLGSKASLLPDSQIEDDEGESSDEEDEDEEEDGDCEDEKDVGEDGEAGDYEDNDKGPSKAAQSIFGGGAAASSTPTFSFTTSTSSSVFGNKAGGAASSEAASTSIFGTPTTAASTSVFGTPSSKSIFATPTGGSPSIFGGAATAAKTGGEGSAGLALSANKNLSSFSALASKSGNDSGFAFGNANASQSFSFAGAGTSLFKASPNKGEAADNAADESGAHEDDGHDPHFEPIVPLPELVNVTTGEEEEEVLFKYRAKVYRYDKDTKQWKERGVGDMKILKHPSKNTFRVLLRREQIHKIACNHLITTDMELKPMMGSETSVSWFAMDYADEEQKLENLAVRFKLADTMNDFKKTFQECQEKLRLNTSSPGKATAPKDKDDKKDPPKEDKPPAKPSIFGSASTTTSGSIFGAASKGAEGGSKGVDLSAGKSLSGFSELAKGGEGSSGFAFGNNSGSTFSFAGAGASIFKQSPSKKDEGGDNKADESGAAEEDNHDPHFEPIIPLPELVSVQTGEEEEEVLFKYRAKVYRYDVDTKQWKERGVGDMKILKHKAKNTFRVLLRRDQIHKIACNHLISTEMELKPMQTSETAVCWFAMDYADEEAKLEHLAVKFKLADTMKDFKKVFEECQEKLKNNEQVCLHNLKLSMRIQIFSYLLYSLNLCVSGRFQTNINYRRKDSSWWF